MQGDANANAKEKCRGAESSGRDEDRAGQANNGRARRKCGEKVIEMGVSCGGSTYFCDDECAWPLSVRVCCLAYLVRMDWAGMR